MPPLSLLAVAFGALAVNPATVPAKGSAQSIVTVDKTSMVHLSTVNPGGTACEVVDHLRGPFANSGVVGKANCDLDLLLDAGVYKVRLTSPLKGKGTATVKAEPFQEVNNPLLRLERGRQVDETLKPHQQASFWIHVEGRTFVPLRVSGRTAGEVKLWKSGEWSESVEAHATTVTPVPGKPIYEWWIGRYLESGDYLLTVYGTNPQKWTRGPEDDALSVGYLFDPFPAEKVADATLPAWGVMAWSLPKSPVVASLELSASPASPVDLELRGVGEDGNSIESIASSCRIEAKALRPRCSAYASDDRAYSLVVRGAPGTKFRLEFGRYVSGGPLSDGDFGSPSDIAFKAPAGGSYLVGAQDVPADPDAAPLSCVLRRARPNGVWDLVSRDFLQVPTKSVLERTFNYDGSEATLWFDVASGSSYTLATGGTRKSYCELYRIDEAGERTRLTESSKDPGCKIEKSLSAGAYELKLYGGLSGIETVKIADSNKSWFGSNDRVKASGDKTACLFPAVNLEAGATYRIETNRFSGSTRGLTLRPKPIALARLLSFELAAGRPIDLPLTPGRPIVVSAEGPISCAVGKAIVAEAPDGTCRIPEQGGSETLTITSRATGPIQVRVSRPQPPPTLPPLQAFNPVFAPPPALSLDKEVYFDFARLESHSLVFEVKDAGLYHLTTVGLLGTSCRIRTQAEPSLTANDGGGRGHNCLVAGYLRPGRYLATVATTGASRGRAGVVLSRRPSKAGPDTNIDSTVFFKTDSDTLITERLLVAKGGRATLETMARGASLSCRLEDKDGWPIERVPTACALTRDFAAGQYLWVQLPLTVESMRRTKFEKIRAPIVLAGAKAHEVGFNTWYQAKLNPKGKDEFVFEVPADLDLQLVLTDAMQGRLYKLAADGGLTPVEFIAPQSLPPPREGEGYSEPGMEGDGGEGYQPEPSPDYGSEGEPPPDGSGNGEGGEGEGGYTPPAARYQPPKPVVNVNLPGGQALSLAAGKYKLIAEHSRADVDVSYRLYLRSDVLAPGIARDAAAPGSLTVRVPREGILRLRSRGESDVRCRLFDASGKLVAESGSVGDDWNCAFAEPLPAGDYRLDLESETLDSVLTHVGVAMPKLETAVALTEGQALKIGTSVQVLSVPDAQGEVVQEVSLVSPIGAPFSCDVSGKDGVIARRSQVKDCSFLLRGKGDKLTVRAWLVERVPAGPVPANVHVVSKPIEAGKSSISGKGATSAVIERDGRYATSAGVFCLPESAKGVLEPCGPEVSLEKGTVIFAALGDKGAKLPLDEIPFKVSDKAAVEKMKLDAKPFIQASRSSETAVHLLKVTGLSGESSAPACAIAGGARAVRDTDCFAASGWAEAAVARTWIAGEPGEAEVTRLAVPKASAVATLNPGQQSLTWQAAPAMLYPPSTPARVDLTLPPETWAVQLGADGKAVDLCPPEKDVARCVLATRGGEILLWGEGEKRAEASVILGEATARAHLTAGLYEAAPRIAGFISIDVPATDKARKLDVEGARSCTVRLSDGTRAAGCTSSIPANLFAELLVAHDAKPFRAVAHAADFFLDGAFPLMATPSATPTAPPPLLPMGRAVPVVGGQGWTQWSLSFDKPAVVHIRGDSGVCGLVGKDHVLAADGLGAGCEIHRLVPAGAMRIVARAFSGQPLTGTLSWTQSEVEALSEGPGPERWIDAGQARLFKFTLASAGRVGIGVQQPAETLACTVRDANQAVIGDGCQQFLKLEAGNYLLEIRAPAGVKPTRFRPVVVGLQGAKMDVPEEYLKDFFQRIGGLP
ncbi:MAG TPA: hypothetical protein VGK67_21435 [Myxococcales bacterium]